MKLLDRVDEAFLDKAFDPEQRKKAIREMAFTRPVVMVTWLTAFGVSVLIVPFFLILSFTRNSNDPVNGLVVLMVAVPGILGLTIAYLRFEDRLRLLKVIDRLQREPVSFPETNVVEPLPIHEHSGS